MTSFKQMDLDAFAAAHRDDWDRLAQLHRTRSLTGAESDELIDRYQAAATELSAIKTTVGQSIQGERLSIDLSRARLRFTGAPVNVLSKVPLFFVGQLPAALYRIRWITLANGILTILIATAYGLWLSANPHILAGLLSPQQLHEYATQKFVGYYSAHPDAAFAGQVWTNNAWIAAQAIAAGITGIWPVYMIYTNALNLGVAIGVLHQYGNIGNLLYIAPHGQLELYSVFTAAAAGMFIAWAWIAPGARTRGQALAEDGRAFFTIVIGLILSLAVSGFIEGFITRQPWPWPIKIGIGTVALAAFVVYQWVVGRRASRAGETGDLDEFEAGARQITAA